MLFTYKLLSAEDKPDVVYAVVANFDPILLLEEASAEETKPEEIQGGAGDHLLGSEKVDVDKEVNGWSTVLDVVAINEVAISNVDDG